MRPTLNKSVNNRNNEVFFATKFRNQVLHRSIKTTMLWLNDHYVIHSFHVWINVYRIDQRKPRINSGASSSASYFLFILPKINSFSKLMLIITWQTMTKKKQHIINMTNRLLCWYESKCDTFTRIFENIIQCHQINVNDL